MNNRRLSAKSVFANGFLYKNPLLVSMLGVCPALATSTTVKNGLTMGLVVLVVLLFSNLTVSLFRKAIHDKIRIPFYTIVIAGYVSAAEMLLKAYLPEMDNSLGFYISLVVVNCVVLSRSEQFAAHNTTALSVVDAIANGLGYTIVLVLVSLIREVLGFGEIFGYDVGKFIGYSPITYFTLPAGGFLVLGLLSAAVNKIKQRKESDNA